MLGPLRNSRLPPVYIILTLGLITIFFYYRSSIGATINAHTSSHTSGSRKIRVKPAECDIWGLVGYMLSQGQDRRGEHTWNRRRL